MSVAENLCNKVFSDGRSIEDLSSNLGISARTLRRWISGEVPINEMKLHGLCVMLNWSFEDLMSSSFENEDCS